MKVAVQHQDLQLLEQHLQAEVLTKVPLGEVWEIKCAVKKDELMILIAHPEGMTVNSKHILLMLKKALQSSNTVTAERVQCFLKKSGAELPYGKSSFLLQHREQLRSPIPPSSALTYIPSVIPDESEAEFDAWVETPDLWTSESERPVKSLLLGIALMGICVFSSAFYLLTRPCVMSECQEMQTATELTWELRKIIRGANSPSELIAIQQQLQTASNNLTNIPRWSSRYAQAQELKGSLSVQLEKINQVLTAFKAAEVAQQQMPPTGKTVNELQNIQHLWRVAIAPLEAISPSNELHSIAQPKLSQYRQSLQTVNQELLSQEQWSKKLNDAKAVATVAQERQTKAKSLKEWQEAQNTWQIAINALNIIPPTSPAYSQAQQLLLEYKPQLVNTRDRATIVQTSARNYQQAINTANQAQAYAQNNQWQLALTYWDQALQNTRQISPDSVYYNQAQQMLLAYTSARQQAQAQVKLINNLQQVRDDVNQICVREIRICTFTINKTGIAISLTPDYERVIATTLSDSDLETTNHWYILQESLGEIGDRVNLPVFIYDTQGQGLYTHIPQS
jgi:tetratricopeptide (TPR) repeat protein